MDPEWEQVRRQTPALWFSASSALFFGVFWGYHAIHALVTDGRFLYAAFYSPASVGCLIIVAWAGTIALGRGRDITHRCRPLLTADGVVVRTGRTYRIEYIAIFVLATVGGTVFAAGTWTERLTFPMTGGQSKIFPFVAVGLALYAAGTLLWLVTGRLRFPEIVCTPVSLSVRSFKVRDEIAWSDIEAIEPAIAGNWMALLIEPNEGADVEVEVFYRGPFAPDPEDPIVCVVDVFPGGPESFLEFLRYYLDNPEARDELGDGRAIERLQQ